MRKYLAECDVVDFSANQLNKYNLKIGLIPILTLLPVDTEIILFGDERANFLIELE